MSHKTKIFFRADGNNKIGLGHVVRSCALAKMLEEVFECHFYIQSPTRSLMAQIGQYCQNITILPRANDITNEAKQWTNSLAGNEIIVLDGYHFTAPYQRILISKGNKLVCVDDIHTSPFLADAIINHAGGISKKAYKTLPSSCFYLGPHYAMLRPAFERGNSANEREDAIFICLGGADTHNNTKNVLQLLEERHTQQHCYVVTGSAYTHKESLRAYLDVSSLRITHFENLQEKEMSALMKKCRYAICPPSSVSYEYLTVGGELYLIQTADNQKHVHAFLIETGLAFNLQNIFEKNQKKIEHSLQQQTFYFDNKAKERFLRLFNRLAEERNYRLIPADISHADLLYNWVNDAEVRKSSLSQATISYEDHIKWFNKKIAFADTKIFILLKHNTPVGQVRIDLEDDRKTWIVDYSIAREFRGEGLGVTIIRLLIESLLQPGNTVQSLKAIVKNNNIPSLQVFEILNFEKIEEVMHKDMVCNVYKLKLCE